MKLNQTMLKKIKGYKAFNKDMTCRGFQFEEGKVYECKEAEICEKGFHFVLDPLDAWSYYNMIESVLHEVESSGKISKHKEDTKISTTRIKMGVKVDLKTLIKASIDFCKSKTQAASGDGSTQAASGYWSTQAASGNRSKQAASGNWSKQAASGDESKQELLGKDSVAVSAGYDCKAKGKIGCWICLSEWKKREDNSWYPFCVKAVKIDGEKIKEDTWYKLKEGEFVEVKG